MGVDAPSFDARDARRRYETNDDDDDDDDVERGDVGRPTTHMCVLANERATPRAECRD